MNAIERPSLVACPGCVAVPSIIEPARGRDDILLAIPSIHCAGCIGAIETGLNGSPGVIEARVNLGLRRLRVRHDGSLSTDALIACLDAMGYEALPLDAEIIAGAEADPVGRDLLMRLGVAFFAMMNITGLSVAVWSGASESTREAFHLISGAIAVPTVIYAGQPFFRSALVGVRAGRLGMDFPISLALILATAMSVYETLNGGRHAYFDAAVMLTFFLLGGRYLDHRTRTSARSAAQELSALEVPRAIRIIGTARETVAVAELRPGDLIAVQPGSRVPADGVVTEGESEIDRSLMTGESLPVRAAPGSVVSAGVANLTGPLTLRVTAAGRDSSLARIAALVAVAEESRSRYTSLADHAARAYVPLVHALSFGAFLVWMWVTGGEVRTAINISAAVLIITCPCALGLAVPAVVAAASGRLFRKGLLIKSGTALERLATVDTVVFDKTGTLTLGLPEPLGLDAHDTADLPLALALADASAHPLAQSLAKALRARGVLPAAVTGVREVPGHGIEGSWQGRLVRLGRADWTGAAEGGTTATHLSVGSATPVTFAFADSLRPGAETLVAALKFRRIEVHLLSGDVPGSVEAMAARLGIDAWTARATPEDKAAYVARLSSEGRRVLMVGDGLNDTAALAEALVSISPATALDAARAASDIVLMGQDLAPVADAMRTARLSTRRIRENFAISVGYNLIAVPLALLGLATPLLAAVAMSLSSVTVTLNALRLK